MTAWSTQPSWMASCTAWMPRPGKSTGSSILRTARWDSPYYVDGKVFIGGESGDLWVFSAGKQLKPPKKIDMRNALKVPPVAVNGVLYVNNNTHLYAIAAK